MFTRSDLNDLLATESGTAVSLFFSTHTSGTEVRQDPIRLKNLLADARRQLEQEGLGDPDVFLAEASALLENSEFWRQRDAGFAIFIDESSTRYFTVPIELEERVDVGSSFALRPLLPLLGAEGSFYVLTATGDEARLREGSRFTLGENSVVELPEHPLRADVESDYENPVQASPANRPNVGAGSSSPAIGNAQVYGDSPAEFRKAQLVAYAAGIVKAVEERLAAYPLPIVVVADSELNGHLRQSDAFSRHLAGAIETNPASFDERELHLATYSEVEGSLSRDRDEAIETAAVLLGRADARATTVQAEIIEGAEAARVVTLLLAEDSGGAVDPAIRATLLNGGDVHMVDRSRIPDGAEAVAVLRY